MIRMSVTDLVGYQHWKSDENSDLESLSARLHHEDPVTPQMEAGRAFATLFERARPGSLEAETVDGWTFDFSELSAEIALPSMREIKAETLINTPSGPVTLVGKSDGLHGRTVHDQKLTERWDAERYFDSLQWRAYLVMFCARAFVYDVFLGRYDHDARRISVVDYHPITFYPYPRIRTDVEKAVAELAAVIREYMPDLDTAPASPHLGIL